MSTSEAYVTRFADDAPSVGGPLIAAATAVATDAASDGVPGSLVIVVEPDGPDHRVIAGGGNSAIRAAVSVAVAAQNSRMWDGIEAGETAERSVASLPEIVRAAAEGNGITSVHVGTVPIDGEVLCVAMWFATSDGVADAGTRRDVLHLLGAAAAREREVAAARAAGDAARAVPAPTECTGLPVGSDDPDIDALTGLASRRRFERELTEFDGEEATLVLLDLDQFTAINEAHGTDVGDRVLQETAVRLAAVCRKSDLLARLDRDEFAVLFHDADRSTALTVSKRLLAAISEPLPAELGPERVTATVAFAHQFGWLDMEELYESAEEAVESGKRAGRSRMIIAS